MAAPIVSNGGNPSSTVPNGAPSAPGHERKPSMNITPNGASTQMPNGSTAPTSNRMSISFGSMPATNSSPAIAHSNPVQPQNANLSAPRADPRITSPSRSPSPIPVPSTSGGRPPATFSAQGNGISFGGMGPTDSDPHRHMSNGPPNASVMPNQHYRRTSSHSQHTDMSQQGMSSPAPRGGYGHGGRGGRSFSGYNQSMHYAPSPSQQPRQMYNQPNRAAPGVPPHFQNQMMGAPGSPHPPRSPAMPGSQPHTPHMQHMHMNNQPMNYVPQYNAFAQQLQPGPGQFPSQPPYDPAYQYYGQGYPMHPQHLYQAAPPSPRPFNQMPPGGRQSFGQAQFQPPLSTAMSRTSSAMSERPSSSIGSGHPLPTTSTPGPSQPSHTPSQSQSAIAAPPSSNFVRPTKSAAVVIKNSAGEVVTFDKKASAVKSPSPAPPSATPPPRTESAASTATSHKRTESKIGKTPEEIRAEFQAQVQKRQEDEKTVKEEPVAARAVPAAVIDESKAADEARKAKEAEQTRSEQAAEAADASAVAEKEAASKAETAAEAQVEAETKEAAAEAATEDAETEEQRKKRLEDEEFERMIAEMEAQEKEEEERERVFQEKKKKEAEEKAAKEKAAAAMADDEMKRLEREAEAAEEARQQKKPEDAESEAAKAERESMFASLKKPTIGPSSTEQSDSGAVTPVTEDAPVAAKSAGKPKPAPLKVEINKAVEPPQPTPGMQSLRSARLLQLQSESADIYPDGIKSPNPAVNQGTKRAGRVYDKTFLLQFQGVFKEKPVVDWDQKLKDTLGDGSDSAVPKSATRTPSGMGPRGSRHGPPPSAFPGPMGSFNNTRTIPSGTTSEQRFAAASSGRPLPGAIGSFGTGPRPPFPGMGQMPVGRPQAPGSNRQGSRVGSKKESHRAGGQSRKEAEQANKSMPLTANGPVKELELSSSGWRPTSIGRPAMASEAVGQLPPDLVQRKVKAALNKMTPERFDKLADEILRIAAQSKDESDGRTLRQVIALTFEKACDESHWAAMYAKFCQRMLSDITNDVKDDNVLDRNGQPVVGGALFRKYLLNRCQEEFEHGWVTSLPEKKEGETEEVAMLSDEYYAAAAIKRKGLGLVQFIGELYKLRMLSIKIMHDCFLRLLSFEGIPDESTIESLVKLLRTVGETMEESDPKGQGLINMYFDRIEKVMAAPNLPSRSHFMLLDLTDLRKTGWKTKGDKGPKTIQQIRQEAEAAMQQAELERARTQQRRPPAGRGDARGFPGNPIPPPDTKNIIGTDDFRRLRDRGAGGSRNASGPGSGPGGRLGPGLGPRTASGAGGRLGPPTMLSRNTDSGSSSRINSQKGHTEEDKKTSLNSFDALADLGNEDKTPAPSPPVAKAQPVAGEAGKSEDKSAES